MFDFSFRQLSSTLSSSVSVYFRPGFFCLLFRNNSFFLKIPPPPPNIRQKTNSFNKQRKTPSCLSNTLDRRVSNACYRLDRMDRAIQSTYNLTNTTENTLDEANTQQHVQKQMNIEEQSENTFYRMETEHPLQNEQRTCFTERRVNTLYR